MSLTALFDKLTSVFSKSFALAAFMPVVIFAFLNGVVLQSYVPGFEKWIGELVAHPKPMALTASIVSLIVAAYMLSTLSQFLREVLEGKHLLPKLGWFYHGMIAHQQSLLDEHKRMRKAAKVSGGIDEELKSSWRNRLDQARRPYGPSTAVYRKIQDLLATEPDAAEANEVDTIVAFLADALRVHPSDPGSDLDTHYSRVKSYIGTLPDAVANPDWKARWIQKLDAAKSSAPYSASSPVHVEIVNLTSAQPATIVGQEARIDAVVNALAESLKTNVPVTGSVIDNDRIALLDFLHRAYKGAPAYAKRMVWHEILNDALDAAAKPYTGNSELHKKIIRMYAAMGRADEVTRDDIEDAVNGLVEAFKFNKETAKSLIYQDRLKLLELMDYAEKFWPHKELEAHYELQAFFSDLATAPTAIGNIAESIQYYGLSRYGFDVAIFWPRFESVLHSETDFMGRLEEAKIKMDFYVACFWLNLVSWITWLILFAMSGKNLPMAVAVCLAGPVIAGLMYTLAVRSYVLFADQIRTAIDLFRFKLLKAYNVDLPSSFGSEKEIWQALWEAIAVGETPEVSFNVGSGAGG